MQKTPLESFLYIRGKKSHYEEMLENCSVLPFCFNSCKSTAVMAFF